MQELNKEILVYLNSLLNFPIIENISLVFVDLPIFFLPIFLVSFWIYYIFQKKDENKKDLLFIFYSCIIALIINLVIQQFVHLDRPESVLEGVGKLILKHLPDASFPSDHTAIGIAFLVSLFFAKYYKIGIIFTIPVILMCISRVVLGVHFPFDILGGAIVGIIGAIISFKFLKKTRLINSLNDFILKIEKKIFAFFIEKK